MLKTKKYNHLLFISLILVFGLLFTSCENKNQSSKNSTLKPLTDAEKNAELKKWEASPDGIMFKKWEASPAGKKVYAAESKIIKSIKDFTNMDAVVTSLSLPPGSRLGFGIMVRMNDDDYILSFGVEQPGTQEFRQLHELKVNDKIIIKSRSVMHAPKYTFPIVSGDYVEKDKKVIYKRSPGKGGC